MSTEDEALERVRNTLEAMFNAEPELAALLPRAPRWRYYGPRGAFGSKPADVYFYTTERVNGSKFQSGRYRYLKSRKLWKPIDMRLHRRRKDAKARARKLFDAASRG